MKNKIVFLLMIIFINLNATSFDSYKLEKIEENIQSSCRLTFISSPGIFFENEEPTKLGYFNLQHNRHSNYDVKLKIIKLLISNNLQNISYSDIYVVFDRTNRIKLSNLVSNNIYLKKGRHSIHLEIEKKRTSIPSGSARLEFKLKTLCR